MPSSHPRRPTPAARHPLRTITFDFWSTLVDGLITPERTVQRLARLHAAIAGVGHACTREELQRAFEQGLRKVSEETRDSLRDIGPPGRWAIIAAELGVPEGRIPFEVVEQAYADITLNPIPDAMPHVHEAVQALREAGYHLGVICNTGMAGGRVLREVLQRHDLLEAFEATVFSDEFGWSKPHPEIFRHTLALLGEDDPSRALHVGDMEELDVAGAHRAGLHAALYVPDASGPVETAAELVVRDWREFPRLVSRPEEAPGRSERLARAPMAMGGGDAGASQAPVLD